MKQDTDHNLRRAHEFVGNSGKDVPIVGSLQLELLKMNGCTSHDSVLEVGCGCLVAGLPIMDYLKPNRYVGIEPNSWLIDAACKELLGAREVIASRKPLFLNNSEFDASDAARSFDFVIAHSVLSHAAHWQLWRFLQNIRKVLAPNGVVIASIRLRRDNGARAEDSCDEHWVYPGVSFFAWPTVKRAARECGYSVQWRKDYTRKFVAHTPSNFHDWLLLRYERSWSPTGIGGLFSRP